MERIEKTTAERSPSRLNPLKVTTMLLCVLFSAGTLHASTAGKVRSGNRQYKKGKFEQSLDKYREAQITDPNNAVVHYNIGDALYRLKNFEEASASFNRALASKDPGARSRAYYNLGNAAFRKQQTDEALTYYKKALDLNPRDRDAKYNIEYLLAQKNMQQQNKNSKDKDQKQNKNDKQDQKNQQERGDQQQQQQGREKKQNMSREDAQRILQYYNDTDKEAARKRKMAMPQLPKTDEDW